jgi:hypothetical protein
MSNIHDIQHSECDRDANRNGTVEAAKKNAGDDGI